MQRFPTAVHDDWDALKDVSDDAKTAIRAGADLALSGLDSKLARVEALGFAAQGGRPLVRARLHMSDVPDAQVWEQAVDPAALKAAGVDFGGPSAAHDVGSALHGAVSDFVREVRKRAVKQFLRGDEALA